MAKIMEIKLLSCPLCLKPHFEGVDALRSTLVSVATSNLSCPVCSESLLGLDKLTIHLFSHINNVKVSVNEVPEKSVCEEIDKSIDSITSSSKNNESADCIHYETKTTVEKNIRCDICGFCFTDQNILDMHQKLLHQTTPDKKTGLYSYHCHLCSKKFKMRGSLMVHLRVAHYGFSNDIPEAHQDPDGKKKIMEPSSSGGKDVFKGSTKQKVQDNKQWECDVCSKLFTTKYFLKKHKRLHTGEMPYTCTLCQKSFTFQQSYHKHMLYHSSEKPYACNECGRAFKELSTLQNHTRIHSGERPFGCETCGKRFRQRVSYLVHRRIHTGVMPYKCTACDKSFRYKVSQRSHKCPMNPPGNVVRIADVSETTSPTTDVAPCKSPSSSNVKCIMSVDFTTGNINFIPDGQQNNMNILYIANNPAIKTNNDQNINDQIQITYNKLDVRGTGVDLSTAQFNKNNKDPPKLEDTNEKDLFSMVMSPLLPDVESLCLSNTSSLQSPTSTVDTDNININVIPSESLDSLLYGTKDPI